ncbi:hypothetical protein BS17DRAFT_485650 [Gyrodon lividus]|nr:hypothetical protein BS17DRAFT_485650 [Gyrodon lividus]
MAHYVFPSSQSYSHQQQPVVYTTSNPSAHSAYYGSPVRRHNSFSGHANPQVYGTNPIHHTPSSHGHAGTQYLVVPGGRRSRSRSRSSHGHDHGHGRSHSQSRHHGHGYSVNVTQPVVYTSSPVIDPGHHRSSHRHPSQSSHRSHHSHHHSHSSQPHRSHSRPNSHSHAYGTGYHPGHNRTTSISDRVRNFFGLEPSHSHAHYTTSHGNDGRRRHNSFSGYRDDSKLRRNHSIRTGPWFFGSTDNKRYVDEHGREVDHRGRVIQRIYRPYM